MSTNIDLSNIINANLESIKQQKEIVYKSSNTTPDSDAISLNNYSTATIDQYNIEKEEQVEDINMDMEEIQRNEKSVFDFLLNDKEEITTIIKDGLISYTPKPTIRNLLDNTIASYVDDDTTNNGKPLTDFWNNNVVNPVLDGVKRFFVYTPESETNNNNFELVKAKDETSKNIEFFIENAKAYALSTSLNNLSNVAKGVQADPFDGTLTAIDGLMNQALGLEYKETITAAEGLKVAGANFDDISSGIKPEITIKTFTDTSRKGKDFKPLYEMPQFSNNFRNNIGYLYIRPISNSNFSPVSIPFEFNPKITEGGVQAKYNATSLIGRIGDLQSFIGSTSNTLTVEAEYLITDDKNINNGSEINREQDYFGWMSYFTLDNLRKIEAAYRSLVLPSFKEQNNGGEKTYTYFKPPVVKVVMGNEKNNLMTSYPETSKFNDVLKNEKGILHGHYKTFIATAVTINKDPEKYFYVGSSDKNYFEDMSGFSVNLTLVEVTESYTDIVPDFKVYYDKFKDIRI